MKIPKIIKKNKCKYIFIKQINENVFLYQNQEYGYNECFTKFDLGMVKEIVAPVTEGAKPGGVKLWREL